MSTNEYDEPVGPKPAFEATLLRRDDFLALRFEFYYLALVRSNTSGEPARLVRSAVSPARRSAIVVVLPPQHFAEESFIETATSQFNRNDPKNGHEAGETELAEHDDIEVASHQVDFDRVTLWGPTYSHSAGRSAGSANRVDRTRVRAYVEIADEGIQDENRGSSSRSTSSITADPKSPQPPNAPSTATSSR